MDVVVIPDIQHRPGLSTLHLDACGRYLADNRPDTIIFLGDVWDMGSLSKYEAGGSKHREGQRILEDIEAGKQAIEAVMQPVWNLQQSLIANHRRRYNPDIYFLMGNHEHRLTKLYLDDARFEGFEQMIPEYLDTVGITCVPFLGIIEVGGVLYSHYFENTHSSTPIGRAHLLLSYRHKSMTAGHRQGLDYAVSSTTVNGKLLMGLIAGSFYLHDEHYKSGLTNSHWRGIIHKHNCFGGQYDPSFISTESLMQMYGEENEQLVI